MGIIQIPGKAPERGLLGQIPGLVKRCERGDFQSQRALLEPSKKRIKEGI